MVEGFFLENLSHHLLTIRWKSSSWGVQFGNKPRLWENNCPAGDMPVGKNNIWSFDHSCLNVDIFWSIYYFARVVFYWILMVPIMTIFLKTHILPLDVLVFIMPLLSASLKKHAEMPLPPLAVPVAKKPVHSQHWYHIPGTGTMIRFLDGRKCICFAFQDRYQAFPKGQTWADITILVSFWGLE